MVSGVRPIVSYGIGVNSWIGHNSANSRSLLKPSTSTRTQLPVLRSDGGRWFDSTTGDTFFAAQQPPPILAKAPSWIFASVEASNTR